MPSRVIRVRPDYAQRSVAATALTSGNRRALRITQRCSLGSSVSPILANLFLHYAFDAWMARMFPTIPFERYVDDVVVHCVSERQARYVLAAIEERMRGVGLMLHPEKTRIVFVSANAGGGWVAPLPLLRCCRRDGGWLALWSLPAGGGFKPPCAAAVNGGSW